MTSDQNSLAKAAELHRAGQLDEAQKIYKRLLKSQPRNHGALHLLGVLQGQRGDFSAAFTFIDKSLEIEPRQPEAWFNRGTFCVSSGIIPEAISSFRRALEQRPDYVDAAFQLAQCLEKTGDVAGAEAEYSRVLSLRPQTPAALMNRGVLRHSIGRHEEAAADFRDAIRFSPADPNLWLNLAATERDMGMLPSAKRSIQHSIRLDPSLEESLWLHAIIADELGDATEAVFSLRKLVSRNPGRGQAVDRLVAILRRQKNFPALREFLEDRLKIFPQERAARAHYAEVLSDLGDLAASAAEFERILAAYPDDPDTLTNLGATLQKMGDLTRARECCEAAVRLRPDRAISHYNLGVVYERLQFEERALQEYSHCLSIDPSFLPGLNNRGALQQRLRKLQLAETDYHRALEIDPKHGDARWNLGLVRLTRGDMPGGWDDYESRFLNPEFAGVYATSVNCPRWKGEPLDRSSSILILHEQGLGDTIQFCRYLPLVAESGAKLTVLAPRSLHRVLRSLPGVTDVAESVDTSHKFNFHCYMMSLPGIFRTTMQEIPYRNRPYLFPDADLVAKWVGILGERNRPRVGICWRGGAMSKIPGRSIDLNQFGSLLVNGADYVSLQKDIDPMDAAAFNETPHLRHFGAEQDDFSDAAAMISLMDLVISVDTSVAHLAGALGKETWVMLPYAADWRWFENRTDCPWYPMTRLFRQRDLRDWSAPFHEITAALSARLNATAHRAPA